MLKVTFLDSLSQLGTMYTNLRWPLVPSCFAKYNAQMTRGAISGAQGSWACSEKESTDRLTAEVRKILFVENLVEKREEKDCILGNEGNPETGDPFGQGGEWVL
jgi:hypothetical protein